MKKITLGEIANACCGTLYGDENIKIDAIVTDSRKVENNSLFCAIKGERVDGHDYIAQCVSNGACILCEKTPDVKCNYILVDSTLEAIKGIAKYYRSLFTIPFIGITGSVGKTSTKEMISAVLSQKFSVHKTQGNFNNELGVPLTLFALQESADIAVIEMGISDFSEMSRLSKMVCPDISVITNIGYCHLENLIDRDGVLKAKTEMLKYLKPDGKMYFCGDDDKLFTVKEHNGTKVIYYGLADHNDYKAEIIDSDTITGVHALLYLKQGVVDVTVPALGTHMVSNALCAAAIGEHFGITNEQIKAGIMSYKTVGARSNVIRKDTITIIDDCYNANPTSVMASISTLMQFNGRKVALIGDMKELGKNESNLHFKTGKAIIDAGVDVVIAVGPLCKHLYDGANKLGFYFESVQECKTKLADIIKKGDTILVKASHSMHFDELSKTLDETFK